MSKKLEFKIKELEERIAELESRPNICFAGDIADLQQQITLLNIAVNAIPICH